MVDLDALAGADSAMEQSHDVEEKQEKQESRMRRVSRRRYVDAVVERVVRERLDRVGEREDDEDGTGERRSGVEVEGLEGIVGLLERRGGRDAGIGATDEI